MRKGDIVRKKQAERVDEGPRVWVFNGTGIRQIFGCSTLDPNKWALVPHNLAERLEDETGYRLGGTGANPPDTVEQSASHAVAWDLSQIKGYPSVAIVIALHNCPDLLMACHDSLKRTEYPGELNLIWVDDASTDLDTRRLLGGFRDDKVLRNETPRAFARSANRGLAGRMENLFCLVNQDCEFPDPHWLTKLVDWMKTEPSCGICGPLLLYPNGTVQHGGMEFRRDLTIPHLHKGREAEHPLVQSPRKADAITGAVFLTSRQLWRDLGGLDERYPFGHEDLDFCLRALLEYGVGAWCAPVSRVTHIDNGVRNSNPETKERIQQRACESEERFRKQWGDFILRRMDGEVAILLPANGVPNERTKFIWDLANHFQTCGQKTVVYTFDGHPPDDLEKASLFETKTIKDLKPVDTLIASGWETAKIGAAISAKRKFYLGDTDMSSISKYVGIDSIAHYQLIPKSEKLGDYANQILGGET